MKGPKQRTTLLAATLAALVSGGVAFQAFAEAPTAMRDDPAVDFEASASVAAALSQHFGGLAEGGIASSMLDTIDSARFAAGTGTLSNALDGLLSNQATLAVPATNEALRASMRSGPFDSALFASPAALAPALDLGSSLAAAFSGDSTGRLSFAQAPDAGQLRASLQSDSSVFANLASSTAPVLDAGAMTAALAAQTNETDSVTDAMKVNPEDGALFANSVGATSVALAARSVDQSGPLAGMRADVADSALFAAATSPAVEINLEALVAALSSDSMGQGSLAAPAAAPDSPRAAMRAELGSELFASEVVGADPQAVDFAGAIAALVAGE